MQFTRYFSRVLKDQGTPDISPNEYGRMLNIIIIENQIDMLQKAKMSYRHNHRTEFLVKDLMKLDAVLKRLTRENTPQNLLKYMLNTSKFSN